MLSMIVNIYPAFLFISQFNSKYRIQNEKKMWNLGKSWNGEKKLYGKERMDLPPIGNLNNEIHPLLF